MQAGPLLKLQLHTLQLLNNLRAQLGPACQELQTKSRNVPVSQQQKRWMEASCCARQPRKYQRTHIHRHPAWEDPWKRQRV
jgi:hypothetical protein